MKRIAFNLDDVLRRDNSEERAVMIGFLKILKKSGHFIIVWSGNEKLNMKKIVEENNLTDFVDLALNKHDLQQNYAPDVVFEENELISIEKQVNILI